MTNPITTPKCSAHNHDELNATAQGCPICRPVSGLSAGDRKKLIEARDCLVAATVPAPDVRWAEDQYAKCYKLIQSVLSSSPNEAEEDRKEKP